MIPDRKYAAGKTDLCGGKKKRGSGRHGWTLSGIYITIEKDGSCIGLPGDGKEGSGMKGTLEEQLRAYRPWNGQEDRDRDAMFFALGTMPDCFTRDNEIAHFSASAWIVNGDQNKTLMVYHNLYRAWAWTGGHADGEKDLLAVALREAREETGVTAEPVTEDIFSLEILTVDGHEKKGRYVPSHLHLNVTYLLRADEKAEIRPKADENAAVRWFGLAEAMEKCREPWMVKRVYGKLNEKLKAMFSGKPL